MKSVLSAHQRLRTKIGLWVVIGGFALGIAGIGSWIRFSFRANIVLVDFLKSNSSLVATQGFSLALSDNVTCNSGLIRRTASLLNEGVTSNHPLRGVFTIPVACRDEIRPFESSDFKMCASNSDDWLSNFLCGKYLLDSDQTAQAILVWQQVPNVDVFFASLGHIVYSEKGDLSTGLVYFDLSTAIDPHPSVKKFDMYRDVCEIALAQHNFARALESCLDLVNVAPNSPSYVLLGRVYFEQSDYSSAQNAFRIAHHIDPKFAAAVFWSGMIYRQTGQKQLAEEEFRKAIEISPSHAWANVLLAELLIERGEFEDARNRLQFVLSLDDKSAVGRAQEILQWLK